MAKYSNDNGKGFYSMKSKVVEEFSVYSVEVNYCKRISIKVRAQKANELIWVRIKVISRYWWRGRDICGSTCSIQNTR